MNHALHSDGELLQQFVATGEQAPFETLVHRHSSLVFGICCRVLGRTHDAEDAAQAVFMTLAHKAGSLQQHTSIAGWLHRVALNVSLRTRQAADRRNHREREVGSMSPTPGSDDKDWEELRPILDQELSALPEKYRIPVILHYIEGRTQEEIALLLGCTYGAVSGRLHQARELLRQRLNRRKVAISASALFLMMPIHAPVAMPVNVVTATVKAGVLIAAGNAAAPSLVSTQAAALTQGALKTMYIAKLKTAALILIAVLAAGGAGAATYATFSHTETVAVQAPQPQPEPAKTVPGPAPIVETQKPEAPAAAPLPPAPTIADDQVPPAPKADAPKAAPTQADLDAWIAGLADADAAKRNEAYNKLRDAGEAARAVLEAAAKSAKAEVGGMAKTLLAVLKVQPILDKVEAAAKDVKTVQTEFKLSALAMGMTISGTGTLKQRVDDKKMNSSMKMNVGAMEMPMLMVNDGTTFWQEMTVPVGEKGMKMVTKFPASYTENLGKQGEGDSPIDIKKYSKMYDFTEVSETTLDGKNVYVISGKGRPDSIDVAAKKAEDLGGETAGKMTRQNLLEIDKTELTIGKDDNLIYRVQSFNKNGKSVQDMQMTSIKLNEKLDDSLFIYCPPPDAQVIDGLEQMKALKAKMDAAPAAAPPPTAPNF